MTRPGVTLLTGFLGSGKTTLVNHVLGENAGQRIAVIVNEFGELGIDGRLVSSRAGDVVELANGCVCCASRGDMRRALGVLLGGDASFSHVLLESSGLADPGPVVEMVTSPPWSDRVRLHGTVTVVDAANFDANLEHAEAAYNQITSADLLVVNKVDLVEERIRGLVDDGLRRLNADADIVRSTRCRVPVSAVLAGRLTRTPAGDVDVWPHADHAMSSVTLRAACLDDRRLRRWLAQLPPNVVRGKGVVLLDDTTRPRVVQLVSGRYDITELPADSAPPPESMLVLIGSELDATAIESGFAECVLR